MGQEPYVNDRQQMTELGGAALESSRIGRVVMLTIDRPEVRNALNPATLFALADAIDAATADEGIGAAVITGAGGECFSSGMDLRALRSDPKGAGDGFRRFDTLMRSHHRLPIVAAVRGVAMGGGFELMLECDLVVAADDARFGLPEVTRGLVPGGGGTLLPARIPLALALEIGLLGDSFDASRAVALGLVNRVCPSENVASEAVALASRIAENPPETVARIRQLMWTTALEGPAMSRTVADSLPQSPGQAMEAAEGVAQFLAHRDRP
jgi:enoyl-CoA hydratase